MKPVIVGLTGGIGSGKSLVRHMFTELGVPALDADTVARTIHQDAMHPATKEIANVFPHVMSPDGLIRRGSLREFFARDAAANDRLIHSVSVSQHAIFASKQRVFLPYKLVIRQSTCGLRRFFQFADFGENWKNHRAD